MTTRDNAQTLNNHLQTGRRSLVPCNRKSTRQKSGPCRAATAATLAAPQLQNISRLLSQDGRFFHHTWRLHLLLLRPHYYAQACQSVTEVVSKLGSQDSIQGISPASQALCASIFAVPTWPLFLSQYQARRER